MDSNGGNNGSSGNGRSHRPSWGHVGSGREAGERVQDVVRKVTGTQPRLAGFGTERVVHSLAEVARRLADPHDPAGRQARRQLPASTGLSEAMVDWALRTNVATATPDALFTLLRTRRGPLAEPRNLASPPRLVVVWLAGNVFTASLRGLFLPLLAGAPVVAKASSRDDVFPRLLAQVLEEVDPPLAGSLAVVVFEGGNEQVQDALLTQSDAVAVYGSDATLASIRARIPSTTRFIPHGHGLGAVYLPSEALEDEQGARRAAEQVALDVAAFDQRGCLSPHAVWVERGAGADARTFARLLAEHGLKPLARSLPRGALPTSAGAAQLQWRGVAAARGELFEGDGYATSYEGESSLRLSPGWRNVSVLDCGGPDDLARRLQPLGHHLKAIGVGGRLEHRTRVARRLPAPLAPRISAIGEMQTPPMDSLADGESPWAGLTRWIEIG